MGGIGPYEDDVYSYVGVGWTKSHSTRIPDRVRSFLKANGFEEDFHVYGGYECEGYYYSEPLTDVLKKSVGFDDQSKRMRQWMNENIRLCLNQLRKIEKQYR